MITVYLASRSEDRDHIKIVARKLRNKNIAITSRWLRYGGMVYQNVAKMSEAEAMRMVAVHDLSDIDDADIVIVFSPKNALKIGTGGRHFEAGYAYATGKPLIVVGKRGNAFHYLPGVPLVDEKDLIDYILSKKWKKNARKTKS